MAHLYSRRTHTTYENFEAECPTCHHWNIFNRETDLRGDRMISFRIVKCQDHTCLAEFAINGDSADPPFAQVFFSAYSLMDQRQYGDAVLAIARAYEMFFAHSVEEMLAWKPFNSKREELDKLNALLRQIRQTTARWTFRAMRNLFANVALIGSVQDLNAAAPIVARLSHLSGAPDPAMLAVLANSKLRLSLQRLLDSHIANLRNRIVHKLGYRPSQSEAEEVFSEARDVVWTLADELDVRFESV